MQYEIGQEVNLWQIRIDPGLRRTIVTNSVLVTVTTDWGSGSGNPFSWGDGDDGQVYKKSSRIYVLPGLCKENYRGVWQGKEEDFFYEAVHTYNEFVHARARRLVDEIVMADGTPAVPQGDRVAYCDKHDDYYYDAPGEQGCLGCAIGAMPHRALA